MPNKKYAFIKLLKEYNKKHGCHHILSSNISKATVLHSIPASEFAVTYTYDGSKRHHSLTDFVYYYVTPSLDVSSIISFILDKEEFTLNLRIEILPSNKIRYAYLTTNYYAPNVGNLGRSCMRSREMQKALNFYVKNKTRIVVVVDDNNKIHARALLWDDVRSTKLKNPFTYLDRVYARSDIFLCLFHDLATTNNWKQYLSTSVDKMNKNYYKEGIDTIGMCHLPYNDTFRYLFLEKKLLTSSASLSMIEYLNRPGSYITLSVHDNHAYYPQLDSDRVREALNDKYISKKDAVFIKRYDGYVLKKNIANINNAYYSVFDDKVVRTKMDGYILKKNSVVEVLTNEKIDKSKATQSIRYKGYIHKSNAVCIKNVWPNNDDEIYHKQDADIICFDNKWYHVSQCFINYNRKNWIPCATVEREGDLIPKERATIVYDLVYNLVTDGIEYQKVYITDRKNLIQLVTGELIINSSKNREHLKKFNNKWYIKREFKLWDKKQLTFSFMSKEK